MKQVPEGVFIIIAFLQLEYWSARRKIYSFRAPLTSLAIIEIIEMT